MAGDIERQQKQINTVRDLLARFKPQLAMAAPKHLTPDRIVRVAMTSIQRNPKLLDCTPESLLGALMTCTQLGLEPDSAGQKAHLIPYKTTCTLVLGYRGLMELARRHEALRGDIDSAVVYSNDKFSYKLGTAKDLTHVPASGDRGQPIGAYAVAFFRDGGVQFEYVDIEEINKVRNRSSGYEAAKKYGKESVWDTDWDAMARKTAIRRLCKYLPSSNELSQALALEDDQDQGLPVHLDVIDVPHQSRAVEIASKVKAGNPPTTEGPPPIEDQPSQTEPEPVNGTPKWQKVLATWELLPLTTRQSLAKNLNLKANDVPGWLTEAKPEELDALEIEIQDRTRLEEANAAAKVRTGA